MSSSITLARPYAKAAFELAQKQNMLGAWAEKLAQSAALASDLRIAALISSPRLQAKDRVALLLPADEAADSAFTQYLHAMAGNSRLTLLNDVAHEYALLRAEAEKTLVVTVRTALAIEAAQQQALVDRLSKRFNRAVTLNILLQPDLIGGAVLDAGDIVIDGSLSGKLQRMHNDLAA